MTSTLPPNTDLPDPFLQAQPTGCSLGVAHWCGRWGLECMGEEVPEKRNFRLGPTQQFPVALDNFRPQTPPPPTHLGCFRHLSGLSVLLSFGSLHFGYFRVSLGGARQPLGLPHPPVTVAGEFK